MILKSKTCFWIWKSIKGGLPRNCQELHTQRLNRLSSCLCKAILGVLNLKCLSFFVVQWVHSSGHGDSVTHWNLKSRWNLKTTWFYQKPPYRNHSKLWNAFFSNHFLSSRSASSEALPKLSHITEPQNDVPKLSSGTMSGHDRAWARRSHRVQPVPRGYWGLMPDCAVSGHCQCETDIIILKPWCFGFDHVISKDIRKCCLD